MSIKLEQYDGWDIVVIKGAMMISKLRHDPPIFGVLGDKPGTHVALDLSETLAIDSGALSVLLTLERRLRMNGGSLVVLSPSEEIRVLFGIVGFDDRIQILDSRREFEAYTHRISR